jgi:hypothetical protein
MHKDTNKSSKPPRHSLDMEMLPGARMTALVSICDDLRRVKWAQFHHERNATSGSPSTSQNIPQSVLRRNSNIMNVRTFVSLCKRPFAARPAIEANGKPAIA